jgi:hypothetical protein
MDTTSISELSLKCIERLKQHNSDISKYLPERDFDFNRSWHSDSKLAAVLVLLYEHAGELRVLLTTRSKALRSHPGQTALPGGKVDQADRDFVQTAVRPLPTSHIFHTHISCTVQRSPRRSLPPPLLPAHPHPLYPRALHLKIQTPRHPRCSPPH